MKECNIPASTGSHPRAKLGLSSQAPENGCDIGVWTDGNGIGVGMVIGVASCAEEESGTWSGEGANIETSEGMLGVATG